MSHENFQGLKHHKDRLISLQDNQHFMQQQQNATSPQA